MKPLCVAALLVACLSLTGCPAPGPAAKYRIAVIPKGTTHEFWQSIERGARRAASDLKADQGLVVDIIFDGPRQESDTGEQMKIIENQLAAGVHGLVLAPQHSGAMVPKVQQAVDMGRPVVIIDSGLSKPELIVKYVATDNYNGGRLAAERLVKVLADAGVTEPHLIMFRYDPGSESTEQREQGFLDWIKDNNVKVTWVSNDQHLGATIDSAYNKAKPILQQKKDKERIDGIFAPNESSATGVLKAMKGLEMDKKVKLVGFDSSKELMGALEAGDVDGLVIQDPYRMGYLGVWTLVQKLEGKDVGPNTEQVKTGEYVITRDTHEPAKRVYKLRTEEALRLHNPDAQAKRTSEELRNP